MKWGVRHDPRHEGEQAKTKNIAKLDKKFERNTGGNALFEVYNHAAGEMNSHEIHRINNKPAYKDKDLTKDPVLRAKYEKEMQKASISHLQEGAKSLGTNASGTKEYHVETDDYGNWKLSTRDVAHDDSGVITVKIKKDSAGHIISMDMSSGGELSQGEELVANFLTHYGVKGMKWGSHKSGSNPLAQPASEDHIKAESHRATIKTSGVKALSNSDLESLNKRMQLEQTHRDLNEKAPRSGFEKGHAHVKKVLKVAKTANDVYNTVNSPLGKTVIKNLKK